MDASPIFTEDLSSNRTTALLGGLMLVFGVLGYRRLVSNSFDWLAMALFAIAMFFGFYVWNFRTLRLELTPGVLTLRFGVFTWIVAIDNIEDCTKDETSLWRIGGAGIHFSPIGGRYRAMFNFLECARVLVALKRRQGLVRDIAFSTRHPEEVIALIRGCMDIQKAGE